MKRTPYTYCKNQFNCFLYITKYWVQCTSIFLKVIFMLRLLVIWFKHLFLLRTALGWFFSSYPIYKNGIRLKLKNIGSLLRILLYFVMYFNLNCLQPLSALKYSSEKGRKNCRESFSFKLVCKIVEKSIETTALQNAGSLVWLDDSDRQEVECWMKMCY